MVREQVEERRMMVVKVYMVTGVLCWSVAGVTDRLQLEREMNRIAESGVTILGQVNTPLTAGSQHIIPVTPFCHSPTTSTSSSFSSQRDV